MISLTADDTFLLKHLDMFVEPVEIYDPAGKLLGLFVPANLERGKELTARIAARIDPAEIERRKQAAGRGEQLHVVLARLQILEKEIERRKQAGEREFTTEEALDYFRALRREGAASSARTEQAPVRMEKDECATP